MRATFLPSFCEAEAFPSDFRNAASVRRIISRTSSAELVFLQSRSTSSRAGNTFVKLQGNGTPTQWVHAIIGYLVRFLPSREDQMRPNKNAFPRFHRMICLNSDTR